MINKRSFSINKCDILIPMFFFQGRDAEAIIPIKFYLENQYHLNVKICSVFDPYMVNINVPSLVLMENTVGSNFHVNFGKYVYKKGYPVVSLVSEGYLNKQNLQTGLWGYNIKHEIFFDKLFLWTPMLKKMVIKNFPNLRAKVDLDISGAVGFDRYQIYPFANKKVFLKKYHKEKYKYVIGYAGWVFSYYYSTKYYKKLINELGKRHFSYFKNDKKLVNDILYETIKSNKDTLFIFKQHPGEFVDNMDISRSWAQQFDNVLFFQSEEPVSDIINVCDVWMVYDSTTCAEAWLLKKPTIVIMPSPNTKYRNSIYRGSVVVRNIQQLTSLIENNKKKGLILGFSKKAKQRNEIIESIIYKNDGFNAKRTADKIYQFFLTSSKRNDDSNLAQTIFYLVQHMVLIIFSKINWLPLLKESVILKWYNDRPKLLQLEKKYYPLIEKFIKVNKKPLCKN